MKPSRILEATIVVVLLAVAACAAGPAAVSPADEGPLPVVYAPTACGQVAPVPLVAARVFPDRDAKKSDCPDGKCDGKSCRPTVLPWNHDQSAKQPKSVVNVTVPPAQPSNVNVTVPQTEPAAVASPPPEPEFPWGVCLGAVAGTALLTGGVIFALRVRAAEAS
jgi:hypothetical protein